MDCFVVMYGRYCVAGGYANGEASVGGVVVRSHRILTCEVQNLDDSVPHLHLNRNILAQVFFCSWLGNRLAKRRWVVLA